MVYGKLIVDTWYKYFTMVKVLDFARGMLGPDTVHSKCLHAATFTCWIAY